MRLYPDFETRELAYYQQTGIWPIMHIIAMQRRILDENPWVARNLYNAFLESKNRSVERLLDPAVSRYPLPWLPAYGRRMADLFGGDPFPYGIEPNRATVGQLLALRPPAGHRAPAGHAGGGLPGRDHDQGGRLIAVSTVDQLRLSTSRPSSRISRSVRCAP